MVTCTECLSRNGECDGECGRKQTNADRIRAMTDEELAEFLAVCDASRYRIRRDTDAVIEEKWRWFDWLKQGAQDG